MTTLPQGQAEPQPSPQIVCQSFVNIFSKNTRRLRPHTCDGTDGRHFPGTRGPNEHILSVAAYYNA